MSEDTLETTYEPEPEIPQDHLLSLVQLKYSLGYEGTKNKQEVLRELLQIIEKNNMLPYYKYLKKDGQISYLIPDLPSATQIQNTLDGKLKELDAKIKDAEENLGESEVREAFLNKAQFQTDIGDKENALSTFKQTSQKTVALGQRLDIVLQLIRLGLAFEDNDIVRRNIDVAKTMIEEGGDWERRNRLKVYEGVYLMSIRNFADAARLFLDSVSTFTATELTPYRSFIFYTIIVSIFALERPELKKKVIDSSDILSVIKEIPNASKFLNSLYNCQYHDFLVALADITDDMKHDHFLSPHVSFYSREMRIAAYTQFLESYKSVTLESMAKQFGLSVQFIDKELSRFIAAGRLPAKIDKVGGVVESTQPNSKNAHYQNFTKQSESILNRIQKLSRVIDL